MNSVDHKSPKYISFVSGFKNPKKNNLKNSSKERSISPIQRNYQINQDLLST
jgi:hypothetical protein